MVLYLWTGASGFPLWQDLSEEFRTKRYKGRCLHRRSSNAPIFSFPKPPDTETGLFAYSDSFLEQTRGALDYYGRLFDEKIIKKHLINST